MVIQNATENTKNKNAMIIARPKLDFAHAAENRGTFFARVRRIWPKSSPEYRKIETAYNTAKEAFREVKRDDGQRYFEHLRYVALICIDYLFVTDADLIAAALLHDIVEDREDWTVERIEESFGTSVAELVDWMSKDKVEQGELTDDEYRRRKEARADDYHARFSHAPRDFFIIKLADRLHNLMTLTGCPKEKQIRKIRETEIHYLPYARRHLILAHEIDETLDELRRRIN